MGLVVIFRTGPAPKSLAESTLTRRITSINKKARVKRNKVARFMLGTGFADLPLTRQSVIDSPERRRAEAIGWSVPDTDLGRKGIASSSQAESIRRWVIDRLDLPSESFSVVYEPGGEM